jgi:hypothetical protein
MEPVGNGAGLDPCAHMACGCDPVDARSLAVALSAPLPDAAVTGDLPRMVGRSAPARPAIVRPRGRALLRTGGGEQEGDDEDAARALAANLGLPYVDPTRFEVDPHAVDALSASLARSIG